MICIHCGHGMRQGGNVPENVSEELEKEYQKYLAVIEKCDSLIVRSGALTFEEWLECREELKEMNAVFCEVR